MPVVAIVDDTDSSLWSSAYRKRPRRRRYCNRLPAAVAGLGLCIWRVRLLGFASWKQFSRS